MEGALRGATLGALDRTVSAPVLLITSTRDALDTSDTAEVSNQGGKSTLRIADSSTQLPALLAAHRPRATVVKFRSRNLFVALE